MLKEKAPLLQIIFAPSGQMIGRQRGTRTCPVVCFVLKLTFLSTTSTFVLEPLFSGRLLVYQWAPTVRLCWLILSFIPSSMTSWLKQWKRILQKPSSSATPFDTSTIYSVLKMWTWNYISAICPSEVCYLDTNIKTGDINTPFCISIYDKRDDFAFQIVNFPHLGSNVPTNPAYGILYIWTGEIC